MKSKNALLAVLLVFLVNSLCSGQTLLGEAAGDFYSAFAKMSIDGKRLNSLEDLTPYIPNFKFA